VAVARSVTTWLTPAGGLVYHLRALRFRRTLWAPFERTLATWLEAWDPGSDAVLLVGPSAGYCLADRFLARFRDVLVLEPDPVARLMLARRLARLRIGRVGTCADDLLVRSLLGPERDLCDLLDEDPTRAVVFCNLLGQVRFLLPDETFETWADAFRARVVAALATRGWVTFHDRLSGEVAPALGAGATSERELDEPALVARFYAAPPVARGTVELVDHLTGALWPPSLARRYFGWEVVPGRFHLIEGISAPRPAARARPAS
jgi:hypothetical protein